MDGVLVLPRPRRMGSLVIPAWRLLLIGVMLPCLVLAVMPDDLPRFWVAAWNFGHVILFWLLTQSVLAWRAVRAAVTLRFIAGVVLAMVALGALIEGGQALIGRDSEFADILADAAGAGLGALFSRHWPSARSGRSRGRGVRYLAAGFLLMMSARDLWLHAADAWMRWQAFPLLYSAQSPLATWARLDRLNVSVHPTSLPEAANTRLLQVDLQPGRYSTLSIDELQADWRDYKTLVWRWYNPGEPLPLVCRAHDRQHVRNVFADNDRFNQRYTLTTGWNELVIPLALVRAAPATREMDLAHMRSLGCFAAGLSAPRRIYLDKVFLRPE